MSLYCVLDVLLIGETVNVIKLQFEHKLIAQNGLAWPPMVKVAVGNEALIKLKTSLEGQSSCVVRSPRGQEFDIFNTPPSDKLVIGTELKILHLYNSLQHQDKLLISM